MRGGDEGQPGGLGGVCTEPYRVGVKVSLAVVRGRGSVQVRTNLLADRGHVPDSSEMVGARSGLIWGWDTGWAGFDTPSAVLQPAEGLSGRF